MTSVNTNFGALVALQNLNSTNRDLEVVQNRISTGLRVNNAADNGAIFAIAQEQRSRQGAIGQIREGITRAGSTLDVALSAGKQTSDTLVELRKLAESARNSDLSTESRTALNTRFTELRSKLDGIANGASFNGQNLLTGGAALSVTTADAAATATVARVTSAGFPPGTAGTTQLDTLERESATPTNFAADEIIRFTQGTFTFDFKVGADSTINEFVGAVNGATGGRIQASYDQQTGSFTFTSSANFSIAAFENDGTTAADARNLTGQTGTGALTVTAAAAPPAKQTINALNFRTSAGGGLSALGSLDLTSATNADAAVTALNTASATVNGGLATLSAAKEGLTLQNDFLGSLGDTIEKAIGSLVDADLAKESARLQSLQTKQQLGTQALSIANQAPQAILSLFR